MLVAKIEIYYAVMLASFFFIILVGIIITTAVLYHNRKKAHQFEVSKFQNTLLQSQLEIQESTLQNIAQEIHDNIGQTLSLVKLNLNTLDPAKPAWEEKTRTSKELVGKAIQDLRNLSKTLHSDTILASGLVKAVAYELSLIQGSGAAHTSLQMAGEPPRLPAEVELILFRMVQEALHNIIKHAKATLIAVKIWADEGNLYLLVADDGIGFDPGLQNSGVDGGSGLRNMHNRARLIGGYCKVHSAPEKGTQIEWNIPYKTTT